MKKLSESTLIPLGIAIVAIGGGAMWLTRIWFQGDANAKAIADLQDGQKAVLQMQTDVTIIKTKVEWMEKEMKR